MKYAIEYTKQATKQMVSIPKKIREAIIAKIEALALNPLQAANVKALKGQGDYRLRVGDYRVVYIIEHYKLIIVVVKIKHRKEAYR